MAETNDRTIRVAVVIKGEDGHGTVASTHCTEKELKNLTTKDFLNRIVAPIAAYAQGEFFKEREKRARPSG